MWIPAKVKKNIVDAINIGSNKAFTAEEIDELLEKGGKYASLGVLLTFSNIIVLKEKGKEIAVLLTEKQIHTITRVLTQFVNENKMDPLVQKADREYRLGWTSKRIRKFNDE